MVTGARLWSQAPGTQLAAELHISFNLQISPYVSWYRTVEQLQYMSQYVHLYRYGIIT